jgi:hypothetical protein
MQLIQLILDHPYATAVVLLGIYEAVTRYIPAARNVTFLQNFAAILTAFIAFIDKYAPNKTENPAEVFVLNQGTVARVPIEQEPVS